MYGDNIIKWKAYRKALLTDEVQKVFTNTFMKQCGLSE
jgi:hypothetical protein